MPRTCAWARPTRHAPPDRRETPIWNVTKCGRVRRDVRGSTCPEHRADEDRFRAGFDAGHVGDDRAIEARCRFGAVARLIGVRQHDDRRCKFADDGLESGIAVRRIARAACSARSPVTAAAESSAATPFTSAPNQDGDHAPVASCCAPAIAPRADWLAAALFADDQDHWMTAPPRPADQFLAASPAEPLMIWVFFDFSGT